jgi:hypothetical protein
MNFEGFKGSVRLFYRCCANVRSRGDVGELGGFYAGHANILG